MNNDFFVSVQGNNILMLRPVPQNITREQALNLAAWIVALTDEDEFQKTYHAVCNT